MPLQRGLWDLAGCQPWSLMAEIPSARKALGDQTPRALSTILDLRSYLLTFGPSLTFRALVYHRQ